MNQAAIEWTPRLSLELAAGSRDITTSQRLRHRVFVEEMGAQIAVHSPGREHDCFDPWCEHLIVRDRISGEVVGTNRLLTAPNDTRNTASAGVCAPHYCPFSALQDRRSRLRQV
jgi:putative hemolysin